MNPDLQDALIAWQGGELPAGRTDALLDRLREDTDFRKALAWQVWTLSLCRVAQAPDPRWLALHEEIGLGERRMQSGSGAFENSLMKTVSREPLRFVSAWWRRAAAAAVAAVVVLSTTLLFQREDTTKETLAVLVPSSDAVWKDAPPTKQSRIVGAGAIHLVRGQARLLFTTGVVMDIEGPADLQLLSVSRVICRAGKLRTRVPKGAEGFCVETPRGAVTDLGTELGISVSRQGDTDVAVFEGQAELSVQIPGQEGTRTALLNANESAGFGSGSGEIRAVSAPAFTDAFQPPSPGLTLPPGYAARLLAARPVHYWRMNRSEGETIPNEITGGPVLRITGAARIESDALGISSAVFRGQKQPGVVHLEEPWVTPADAYALEFWFMTDTLDQMALAALTTTDEKRPHIGLVEIGGRRPGESASAGVLRYLLRWPPGHRDGMNLYSPPATALPYQWHHVVAQQSEGRMQLFFNGHPTGPAHADTAPQSVASILHLGCLEFRPGQDISTLRRAFSGRIAEVAVYDRALGGNEIAAHATRE